MKNSTMPSKQIKIIVLLCNVYDLPCSILYQVHSPPHPISTPPLLPFILFHLFSFLLPFSSLTFYHETSSLNPPPTFPPLSSSPFISFPFAFPLPFPFLFFFLSFSGERSQDQSRNGCVKESSALGSCRHCTVVQNSHESRRQYWATCFSVCSFTSTAQTFACSALFASLARSAALIRSLARLLAHSRAHGRMDY